MKRFIVLLLSAIAFVQGYAQGYDEDRIALSNFIERMYKNEPFEGCRVVEDYNQSYLLSIVVLEKKKHPNASSMNRVAQVKSQRNAGEFFNGTQSYSEFIVKTPKCEKPNEKAVVETLEVIKVNSTGFVKQLQLLKSFDEEENKVFIYYKPLKDAK